jgi:hypothetical protein
MKCVFQLVIACLLPLPVFSQEEARVTGAKITEVGIYASQIITDETNATGVKLQGLDNFKLLMSTTNVPARIGIRLF